MPENGGVDEALQARMAAGRSGAIIVGVDHSGPFAHDGIHALGK